MNFGGIGMVIGHELTHGFDDQGRQFDAHGNLKDWWTPKDARGVRPARGLRGRRVRRFLGGARRVRQRQADAGREYRRQRRRAHRPDGAAEHHRQPDAPRSTAITPEQRFFLSFGQIWCENAREEALRLQVQTNEHSPAEFRVNGVVENMPEFQKAFACKPGQPMAPVHACHVW